MMTFSYIIAQTEKKYNTVLQKERCFFMNRTPSPSPDSLEGLLQTVSKKLNVPPEQLRADLKAGKFDAAIRGMKPEEAAKFQQAVANPQLVEKLMSTPQARALYEKLTGGK